MVAQNMKLKSKHRGPDETPEPMATKSELELHQHFVLSWLGKSLRTLRLIQRLL